MTPLQQSDLHSLTGKKVKVLMAGRFYQRVLHEDSQGFFIRYANNRVPVKPDLNSLHILFFTALKPKGGEIMSLALRLWQEDALHEEMSRLMFQHISLLKEFSTASFERKQEIVSEIQVLRGKREHILREYKTKN